MTTKDLKPFKKGDPRINRKGRPKAFDAWRALLQQIASEPATNKGELILIKIPLVKNGEPVFDDNGKLVMVEHYATNAEMKARQLLSDPKQSALFIENTYGKVPQPVEVTGKGGKDLIPVEAMKPSEIAAQVAAILQATNGNEKQ